MDSSQNYADLLEPGLRRRNKMPMKSKKGGTNISEFHHGGTYARTKNKFGKARADKQAIAAGMNAARKASAKGHRKGY
jgi:hypothetical protein